MSAKRIGEAAALALCRQLPGAVDPLAALGIVAFDHVDLIETLPPPAQDPLGFPDFVFWLAESLIVFEPGARPRALCTAFGSADPKVDERAYFGATQRLAELVARCG